MIPRRIVKNKVHLSAPRIRGDDPVELLDNALEQTCSPHPRG